MSKLLSKSLNKYEHQVAHGFFTRKDISPENPFSPSDDRENNSRKIAGGYGRALQATADFPLLMCQQIHSSRVITATAPFEDLPEGDALVTNVPRLALGIVTADCCPVLLYDPYAKVIGALHAGWRGAYEGIIVTTLEAMQALGASPHHISAALGPCIHQPSYEVDEEFLERFIRQNSLNAHFFQPSPGKMSYYLFDLPSFVETQLKNNGVNTIEILPYNTYTQPELFFSHRRKTHYPGEAFGRQLSVIALK